MKHKLLNKLATFAALVCIIGTQPLSADTVTYIVTDPAGSPIAGMNQAGAITWRENYQPFGEKLENAPASTDNDIWFGGKEFDDDTELSFFGARYYEPTIGRFVSIDPQGFDEENIFSFGRYAYGNNNPYKFVDPDGETPAHILAALAVVAARGVVYVARSAKSLGKVVKTAKKGGNVKQTSKGSGEKVAKKTTQSGVGVTRHSVRQKINRQVRSADELDAIKNPLDVKPVKIDKLGRPSQRSIGRKAEVVRNPKTGNIVSVNPTSTKKVERLLRTQGGQQ